MNEYTLADIAVGFSQSFTKEITTQMEDSFRCITGDENPLHKDDTYAASVSNGKFSRHVSFGMLTASLYSTLAGMYIPGKYSLIHSFENIKFLQPVFAGKIPRFLIHQLLLYAGGSGLAFPTRENSRRL